MFIQISAVTKEQQGPDVAINCPACGAENVPASSFESTEVAKLFFFIPVLRFRNAWLVCSECKSKLVVTTPLSELETLSPEALTRVIRYNASGTGKLMAILAILTSLVPVLGVIVAAIACFLTRGTKGWPKGLSVISVILAVVVTFCVVFLLFI